MIEADETSNGESALDRLMDGLPADVVLRKHMRRAATGLSVPPEVTRILEHEKPWASLVEILDDWTLEELVAMNRRADIADRLRVLQEKRS